MVRIKITSKQTNGSAIINAEKKIIVFFIGGAGDKNSYYGYGPTKLVKNSILHVFKGRIAAYSLILPHIEYLGYEEIRGEDDIKKNVIDKIASKDIPIYIVGHSLGGWNSAHLCKHLVNNGYNIRMLVTLDPVGEGVIVYVGSDIYKEPEANPGAKIWINISCNPIYEDQSDKVADFGERWFPKNGPTIYYESKCSHAEVLRMFMENILQDKSALDLLIEDIVK